MGKSTKILKKLSAKLESEYGTYVAPDVEIPFTSKEHKQNFTMLEDESIIGVAFKDLPLQGHRAFAGSLEAEVDVDTIGVLLEAAFGANSSGVFTLPTTANEKSLSLVALDAVKTNKYAGVCINNLVLKSEAEGKLLVSMDLVTSVAETRDDTSFPAAATNVGTKIAHLHASGTGYVRLGDQSNALAEGDNLSTVKSISVGANWGFELDYVNAVGSLQPLSDAGECSFELTLAEHSSDAYAAWRDAGTKLQAEIYYYVSATASVKIEISNILIEDVAHNDDKKTRLTIKFRVGRNGTGTSYQNANMAFVSPIRVTVDNS